MRAVVVQFVIPSDDHPTADAGQTESARRSLSFAGTLSAEPELAERAERAERAEARS